MKRMLLLGAVALGSLSVYAAPASAQTFCSTPAAYSTGYSVRVGYGHGDRHSGYGHGRHDDRRYPPDRYDGHRRHDDYRGHDSYRRESRHAFRVVYRPSCHASWQQYGCYDCREDADCVARSLCRNGAEALVRCD